MRTRFCATIRRPACSIMALIGAGQIARGGIRLDDRKGTLDRHRLGPSGDCGVRGTARRGGRLIAAVPPSGKVWAAERIRAGRIGAHAVRFRTYQRDSGPYARAAA